MLGSLWWSTPSGEPWTTRYVKVPGACCNIMLGLDSRTDVQRHVLPVSIFDNKLDRESINPYVLHVDQSPRHTSPVMSLEVTASNRLSLVVAEIHQY
jgi:hypothetical protein